MFKIDNNAPCLDMQGHRVAEITSDWFYHVLEAVPPIDFGRDWFICGEPYSTDGNGKLTYHHFVKYLGKYYVLADMTPKSQDVIFSMVSDLVDKDYSI